MARWVLVLLCIGRAAGAFEPLVPDGDCAAAWAKRGFTSEQIQFAIDGPESYSDFYRRLERDRCAKEWLIVIYMAADNSLSPYSYRDLWEMQAAGSAADVDTVVFHASAREDGFRYYHIAHAAYQRDYRRDLPEFTRVHELTEQSPAAQEEAFLNANGPSLVVSPVVRQLPQANSTDRRPIDAFLQWAFEHYPSRRVAFIGWSHGTGFSVPTDTAPARLGFELDTAQTNYLPIGEVTAAARDATTYLRGKAFDIVGSDACLNQQVEFGFEWLGLAQYVFGSSTIMQNKGFNYRTLLRWFNGNARSPSADLAQRIPAIYGTSVTEHADGKYSSYADPYATMATWTVAELPALQRALNQLAELLLAQIESPDPIATRGHAEELRRLFTGGLRVGGTSTDLHNLLQVIDGWAHKKKLKSILDAGNFAEDALERAVLARFIGTAYQSGLVLTSKGVAVWLPSSAAEYRRLFPVFATSRFYQGEKPGTLSSWAHLVQKLFGYQRPQKD